MIVKKILSLVASIIKLFIIILLFTSNSKAEEKNIKYYSEDRGILSLMYHRFDENKYPSTNIKIKNFVEHLDLIKKNQFKFINPNNFEKVLLNQKYEKKILLTIDDGFKSFYDNAWPILKREAIPFILFVNTREVGSSGYMNWAQINEIAKEEFVHIGNHSFSHGYLVDKENEEIIYDINRAITDFKNNLGYNSLFFSYPFGEYSINFKNIIKNFGFKFAFGQHSGVADETKNFYELPRFPINETYGEMNRFELILKTIPLKVKSITPDEKYISGNKNPPEITVEFFSDIKNIRSINCYSNELNSWKKSEIGYLNDFKIKIKLRGKFTTERGRVNCSLRESDGSWRWLGMQFIVAEL